MSAVRVGGSSEYDLVIMNDHLKNNLTDIEGKANSFLATSGKGAWANGMSLIVQRGRGFNKGGAHDKKSTTLSSHFFEQNNYVYDRFRIRRITPTECARLQTIPEWYKWGCSETQQYRMLGNGWTVEVIKHIFSFMNIK